MSNSALAQAPPSTAASGLDHLSWSGIQMYKQCQKKYFFKYIEKVPVEFVPASLAFGAAFHRAAEFLQQRQIEGAALPQLDELLAQYHAGWKEITTEAAEIAFPKNDDAGTLSELASRMLSCYRDHVEQTAGAQPSRIIAIEHAHRFRLLADVPPIEMRLDLLELSGPDLIVTDIKTSRSRWNELKIQESLPQLVLYAYGLLDMVRELGAKRIVPRFLVVTKGKKPVVQIIEPKATQEDAVKLRQQVSEAWSAIKAGVFIQRESWQCAQCPYKKRCLG